MADTIVVTGGAGYVGAHVCLALAECGYRPVALDNLSDGRRAAVRFGPLELLDVTSASLGEVLTRHAPTAVVHAAARADVAESFSAPELYRHTNVQGTRNLVDACLQAGVPHLVFISSAAVYGTVRVTPIRESAATRPVSPYGHSKLDAERLLAAATGLSWAVLRLFNVAGAAAGAGIGEDHAEETHLVPLAIRAALGAGPPLRLFGTGYATPDATALRDYVHVVDVAEAVYQAIGYLRAGGPRRIVNIGSGTGTSVREVVSAVERATGRAVPVAVEAPRPGDPAVLVADTALARRILGFRPARSRIDRVVVDALAWEAARAAS